MYVTVGSNAVQLTIKMISQKWLQENQDEVMALEWLCTLSNVEVITAAILFGWFWNVVGRKTQISVEPGGTPEKFTWKVEKEQCLTSQLIKVTN